MRITLLPRCVCSCLARPTVKSWRDYVTYLINTIVPWSHLAKLRVHQHRFRLTGNPGRCPAFTEPQCLTPLIKDVEVVYLPCIHVVSQNLMVSFFHLPCDLKRPLPFGVQFWANRRTLSPVQAVSFGCSYCRAIFVHDISIEGVLKKKNWVNGSPVWVSWHTQYKSSLIIDKWRKVSTALACIFCQFAIYCHLIPCIVQLLQR